MSHAFAGVVTCAHIHSIELDRKYYHLIQCTIFDYGTWLHSPWLWNHCLLVLRATRY